MPTPSLTPEGRRRDHTGTPLPHGAAEPPRGFAMEHDVSTVEQALAMAIDCWDRGRYFEAHELLEHVWHHAPPAENSFWKGVIQVAVVHVLGQRRRPDGVLRMAAKARGRLAGVPSEHHGIDVEGLRQQLATAERLAVEVALAQEPAFPVTDRQPWFDAATTETPLTREPPWLVASLEAAQHHTAEKPDAGEHEE